MTSNARCNDLLDAVFTVLPGTIGTAARERSYQAASAPYEAH